jgi:hypothetical protein
MLHYLTTTFSAIACALAVVPALGAETGVPLTMEQGIVRVDAPKKHPLTLSAEQRQSIVDAVMQVDSYQPTPKGFEAAEGAGLPPTLNIHALPRSLVDQMPVMKEYMYAHVDADIVIVDASEKKVAVVIALPDKLVMKSPDTKQAADNAVGGLVGLTPEQRQAIYEGATGTPQAVPKGVTVRANAEVPAEIRCRRNSLRRRRSCRVSTTQSWKMGE